MLLRRLSPFWLLTLALLLAICHTSQAAEDRGLVYEARKGSQKITLLGSIHLADPSFYPLRKKIRSAYENSDALVVEADILSAEKDLATLRQITAETLYPPEDSLRNHISPDLYKRLQAWLKKRGVPESSFARMRPAIAMITLSLVEMQARGLDPQLGIDRHFLKLAHSSGKPILELESVLGQLRMLNSLKNPDLYLQQTLDQLADFDAFVQQMKSAWKSGNSDDIYRLVISKELKEHQDYAPLYDALFFKRNREMAENIDKLSQRYTTLFVVVGAGHLVGSKSVTDFLEQSGFTIEQI